MKLFTRKKYFYYNKLISRFTQLILKLKNNIWSCNPPSKKLLTQHKTILINRSYDITVKIIIIRSIKKLQKSTLYTVMQSDRNSSKTDTFHEPITYKPRV